MSTLTIHDVDGSTEVKLQDRASRNGHTLEAEVRQILDGVVASEPKVDPSISKEEMTRRLDSLRGIWGPGNTDEFMRELRGED